MGKHCVFIVKEKNFNCEIINGVEISKLATHKQELGSRVPFDDSLLKLLSHKTYKKHHFLNSQSNLGSHTIKYSHCKYLKLLD